MLSQQRFAQLDALLNKAGMYTQFLTEQMQAYAAPASGSAQEGGADEEEEAAAEEDDAAAGGRVVLRCWSGGCLLVRESSGLRALQGPSGHAHRTHTAF